MGPPQAERPVVQLIEEEQSKLNRWVKVTLEDMLQIICLTNVLLNYRLIQFDIASVIKMLGIAIGFNENSFWSLRYSTTIS